MRPQVFMGKQVQGPLQPKSWGKNCRPSDSMALLYVVSSRPVCFHFRQNDIVLLHECVLQQNSVYFSLSVKSWNYEIVKYHASCAECILLLFSLLHCSRLMNFYITGWFVYGCIQCSESCIRLKFLFHSFLSMALGKKFGLLLSSNFLREISGPMVSFCAHYWYYHYHCSHRSHLSVFR